MSLGTPPSAGYWYGETTEADGDPRRALEALRSYRAAELAMRKRTRDEMAMNETDLSALRFVMRARAREQPVTPTDLMNHLGVTMASVTVMLDRLERSGHVRRELNPHDRRSRLVTCTDLADAEVRATLDAMHRRMMGAVAGMTHWEVDTVVEFLGRMEAAVDAISPAP